MFLQERKKVISQLFGERLAIWNERNGTDLGNGLGEKRPHQIIGSIRDDEGIEMGRGVSMQYGLHIRSFSKEVNVHGRLARWLNLPFDGFAQGIDKDDVLS